MKHKVIKVGSHSLAVIIPAKFVHALGIKAGDEARIKTHPQKGRLTLFFSGILQLPLINSKSKEK